MAACYRRLIISALAFSYHILPTIAGSGLCVLFKSSPRWSTLTADQRECTTSNVSPAWTFYSCNAKDCFCNDPPRIEQELMTCILQWGYIRGDPLDAYNGAMNFYATECGTFEFQKKDYLSQSVTFSKTYPTEAPEPGSEAGAGVQAVPTDTGQREYLT
ncbi:hypothetical protein V8F20_010741 [Naviculisporaceae sp. PSN 640]